MGGNGNLYIAQPMEKWFTNPIEAPYGLLHLNKKHSSVFQACGRPNA